MAMATMLLALAAAATALPEDHPTCLAACAGLSCARFAPATCAMVERDLGCACAGCACLGRRLAAAAASNDTLLNETLLNSTALNASASTQETDTEDDDDGAPAAWSLTGTYVLLALAAAVAAAAAKKRQEGPVDARAVAGCLAAVAVAVAVLLGQGVLEYEYEFLFDAGAMGRFDGLVPQAVPDTVPVQSHEIRPDRPLGLETDEKYEHSNFRPCAIPRIRPWSTTRRARASRARALPSSAVVPAGSPRPGLYLPRSHPQLMERTSCRRTGAARGSTACA